MIRAPEDFPTERPQQYFNHQVQFSVQFSSVLGLPGEILGSLCLPCEGSCSVSSPWPSLDFLLHFLSPAQLRRGM